MLPRFWRCRVIRCGRGGQGDIGHGARDLVPEKITAQHDALVPAGDDGAAFRAGQAFGAEIRIGLGKHVAGAKTAIEFVQSGRAEGAVTGGGKRNIAGELVQKRQARTEEGLAAIGQGSGADR